MSLMESAVPRSSVPGIPTISILIFKPNLSNVVDTSDFANSETTTIASLKPERSRICRGDHIMGTFAIGSKHFGCPTVNSVIREPFPPASTTAWNSL